MSQDLTAYPEYRDGGLGWLGQVPAHWQVMRNGRLFAQRNETGFPDLPVLEVSLRTGVRVRDMATGRKQQIADRNKYKRAAAGDIAYNIMRMWQGAVGIAPCDGLISPAYVVARPLADANSRYFSHLFRTKAYMAEVNIASRGIVPDRNRLYWQYFKPLMSPVPPIEEQVRIADFVDSYSSHAHRLVKVKKQIRKLVLERREEIVRGLVFGGLNDDAIRVQSNIAWIGQTPASWSRIHLGSAVKIAPGFPFDARLFGSSDGTPLIRIRNLLRGCTDLRVSGRIPEDAWVDDGDLIVGMDGDFNSAIWRGGKAALNQRLCCLRPRGRLETAYLALVVPFALKYINNLTFSTTVKHLSVFDLRRLRFPIPDRDEQLAIVTAVIERTEGLDATVARIDAEIGLIEEYRDAIVTAAVTGGLDVRNAQVQTVVNPVEDDAPDEAELEEMLDAVD
jgi:type I restriction enzyme S subunit